MDNETITENTDVELNSSNEETENSENVENQEPEVNSDNSEENTQEPETKEDEQQKSKFNSVEEATKSYTELEKKLGQQSNELGELRKIKELYNKAQEEKQAQELQQAKSKGFETVEQYQQNQAEVDYVVSEYKKHINEVDFPDEIAKLLDQYQLNPTNELLDTIEAEFPLPTVKKIAGSSELYKGQLQQQQNEALTKQLEASARNYLETTVPKYEQEFKSKAFQELFGLAFKAYGVNLQADKLVDIMHRFAEEVTKENAFIKSVETENKEATDEIAGLSNGGSRAKDSSSNINLADLSEDELDKMLDKYI